MEATELKKMRDKCLLFNRFKIESGFIPKELIGIYQEASKLIEIAYQEEKEKPLKAANADIDDQVIRHMPIFMAAEVKRLFKEKLNVDLAIVKKDRLKAIEIILKTGKISTDEGYGLVMNRIDEIYSDNNGTDEGVRPNDLLRNISR